MDLRRTGWISQHEVYDSFLMFYVLLPCNWQWKHVQNVILHMRTRTGLQKQLWQTTVCSRCNIIFLSFLIATTNSMSPINPTSLKLQKKSSDMIKAYMDVKGGLAVKAYMDVKGGLALKAYMDVKGGLAVKAYMDVKGGLAVKVVKSWDLKKYIYIYIFF